MVQITAVDIARFRAAERVVFTEDAGAQKVACHTRSGRRRARLETVDEITIRRFAGPAPREGTQLSRSLTLNRRQMDAWRHLCTRLRTGDRLTLAWQDRGWPRRRTAVTVLVTRGPRLHRYQLGEAREGPRTTRTIGMRPGRLVLVLAAAAGLYWLARNHPALAVVAAALVLVSLVFHHRRARDGWPLGTVRWLRLLALVGLPIVLTLLVVGGVVYGAVGIVGWTRKAWHAASGRWATTPARSWHGSRPEPGPVIDVEPDADGVHRRRASGNGDAHGHGETAGDKVVPIVAANNSRATYRRHVDLGAKSLDVVATDWEPLVDLELLAGADDPGGRVLESVFGGWDAGLDAILDHLNSGRTPHDSTEEQRRADALEDCVRAAFGDACTHIGRVDPTHHQQDLRAAWCDELARRTHDHAPAS